MADIYQLAKDLGDAAQALARTAEAHNKANAEYKAADTDEAVKNKKYWVDAWKRLNNAKTEAEKIQARRDKEAAEAAWKAADTRKRQAAKAVQLAKRAHNDAHRKFEKSARDFHEAWWKLAFP